MRGEVRNSDEFSARRTFGSTAQPAHTDIVDALIELTLAGEVIGDTEIDVHAEVATHL